jgi:tetratricopeptide (TPR) repeat protein
MRYRTLFVAGALCAAVATQASAQAARFEVTSLKAVRPTITKLIADLEKKDAAAGKADIAAFDSAWVGVEVYVNVRSMDAYNEIEHNFEAKVTENLNSAMPDVAKALADAKSLLGAYDAMLAMVEKASPLNAKFDDVARLRIERSHLRDANNFLKAGDMAKAKAAFNDFNDNWDNIEDLVKVRSREAYDSIEKGMVTIERQLMPAKPNVDEVAATITAVMTDYNKIVTQLTREARDAQGAK